jgi:hypothetical protein
MARELLFLIEEPRRARHRSLGRRWPVPGFVSRRKKRRRCEEEKSAKEPARRMMVRRGARAERQALRPASPDLEAQGTAGSLAAARACLCSLPGVRKVAPAAEGQERLLWVEFDPRELSMRELRRACETAKCRMRLIGL